jgi:hypothetical protein
MRSFLPYPDALHSSSLLWRALLLIAVLLVAPAPAGAQDTPGEPVPAGEPPAAEPGVAPVLEDEEEDDEDVPLTEAEVARILRAARKALENFQAALMAGEIEEAWDLLSSTEQEYLHGNDIEHFRESVAELREDEEAWVIYRTMVIVDLELDVDDPVYAYATVRYEDDEGEEDEDEVDLVLERGRWKVEGYF